MRVDTPRFRTAQPAGELPWLAELQQKVTSLQFGQITLTIHDNRVVQLDVNEKTRFDPATGAPARGK